jgi:hypothetical protein
MYVGEDWDDLEPSETLEILSIEFTKDLVVNGVPSGETIASATVTASVVKTLTGATADTAAQSRIGTITPSSEVDPTTGLTRSFVNFQVGRCLAGNKYLFDVLATLSSGRTPARFSHAWCKAPS